MVVQQANGLPDFNALQNAFDAKQGSDAMTYFMFDVLFLDGKDLRALPFGARRQLLETVLSRHQQERVRLSATFDADGASVLQSACKMGLEGIIAKRLDAPYKGTRDESWLKIMCQRRQEFVIGGFVTRTGSGREIGSLLLGVYDDEERLRYAGSVGTGWDSTLAAAILRQLERIETDTMPFDPEFPPKKGRWSKRSTGSERWVAPTTVCEVTFTEWTPEATSGIPHSKGCGRRRGLIDSRDIEQ